MDRSILEEHQRVFLTLAISIANKDVRIDKFRGYKNEDITRWFRKLELQLEVKKIPTTDPAAITQVVNNLGGPAETFYERPWPIETSANASIFYQRPNMGQTATPSL